MKQFCVAMMLAIAMALVGCGSSDSSTAGGGTDTKATETKVDLKDKIVGTWKADFSSLGGTAVTEEMKKNAEFKKLMDEMQIELKADGTYTGSSGSGKP